MKKTIVPLILALAVNTQASLITYQAGDGKLTSAEYADASIQIKNPNNNYGAEVTVSVKYDATKLDTRVGLIGFFNFVGAGANQIAQGSLVNSAILTLKCTDGGRQENIYVADRSWAESTVTWNSWTGAGSGFGTLIGTLGSPSIPAGTYNIDITTAVQGWVNTPSSNHGLVLESNNGGTTPGDPLAWFSSENADTAGRPLLTINYTLVPEPATAGMLLIGLAGVALRRRQKVQQA